MRPTRSASGQWGGHLRLDNRGFDPDWPRRLYGHLNASGLTEVGMEGHLAVREGGGLGTSLDAANFAQVREEAVAKGLITDTEFNAVLVRLDARDFAVFSLVMFTAWGHRPGVAGRQSNHDLAAGPTPPK